MSDRIGIVIAIFLGLSLSIVTPPASVSPGLAKGIAWFLAGILSKFK